MLKHIKSETFIDKRNQKRSRNRYVYFCDQCNEIFELTQKLKYEPRLHFCSTICCSLARKKGGALCNKQESTNMTKFGSERPMQNKVVKSNRIKTNVEKYGVTNPMKVSSIKEKNIKKMRKTFQRKYGVEHPLQVKTFAEKAHKKALQNMAQNHHHKCQVQWKKQKKQT